METRRVGAWRAYASMASRVTQTPSPRPVDGAKANKKGRGRARLAAPPEVVVLEDLHLRAADGRAGLARDLPEVVHVEHAAEGAPVAVAEVLGADLGGEALRVREDDAPAARVPLAERLLGPAAHEVPEGLDEPAL